MNANLCNLFAFDLTNAMRKTSMVHQDVLVQAWALEMVTMGWDNQISVRDSRAVFARVFGVESGGYIDMYAGDFMAEFNRAVGAFCVE